LAHQGAAVALLALVLTLGGCSATDAASPAQAYAQPFDNVDRVSLLAWRETLGPSYPLTVQGRDSAATIVKFFDVSGAGWRDTTETPQFPLTAAFYAGSEMRGELGIVESSYGQGGFLVSHVGSRVRVRTASAADVTRFLAFFGVNVQVDPYPATAATQP
jgi:hypothetical protein